MCTEIPIRIYMGCLILGYRVFCFFKLFIIGGKELIHAQHFQMQGGAE